MKLKIEDENAHRKIALQDFKTAPQAAYNQIKLLNCACIEGKNILHHFNNIISRISKYHYDRHIRHWYNIKDSKLRNNNQSKSSLVW